ncbi:MAG: amino acid ABC transporter permease [Oscillospiraceae bacterium]|nr:amino acid ABC transporter permease [Oscillospiraceae bacterium]
MLDSITSTAGGWIDSLWDVINRVFIFDARYTLWLEGLGNTLIIAFFALIIGLVFGFFLAVIRVFHGASENPSWILRILNRITKIFVTIIRGTPVMVQLLIFHFIILVSVRNGVLVGIIAFGINSSAYASEIFRGGILSVDKGQTEAGRSLGLNYRQTMSRIILPQAIKNSLPALGNEFITVLKETSLAGVIAITDVTRAAQQIRGRTFDPTPLIFLAIIYLIMVLFLEFLIGRLERRLRRSDQR